MMTLGFFLVVILCMAWALLNAKKLSQLIDRLFEKEGFEKK